MPEPTVLPGNDQFATPLPAVVAQQSWTTPLAAGAATVAALALYVATLARGITWAHDGADSGELLAAAVSNGVPHPPGYPLYMLLLQGWLGVTSLLVPTADLAWRGNLLSAFCSALSVGVTVLVLGHLLRGASWNWLWALLAGLAWAVSPLLWSQALITEVYALHALFVALLGWVLICKAGRARWLIPVLILGMGHHLTFLLLMPAVFYFLWSSSSLPASRRLQQILLLLGGSGLLSALIYLRTPWAASGQPTPPVNWGYADNPAGFWWLVSGSAYRGYLFSIPAQDLLSRMANWAYTITVQYTPVGLGLALIGLSYLDASAPRLRNFSLLWILPVSLYSISYYTRDSEIYLLPVGWLMALWLGIGLATVVNWLTHHSPNIPWRPIAGTLGAAGVAGLLLLHLPEQSLRYDAEAVSFLNEVESIVEPSSIIVTTGDPTTFAVWYGAWGSGTLLDAAPDAVIVNHALYQFDWYRRLLENLYPTVPNVGVSTRALIEANLSRRPIYLADEIDEISTARMEAVGPLWRITE
jgi:hypothetical protein